ncbi:MAG: PIG-L deacetylase family protein [Candidatus Dormibacteraceae bacterium]
MALQPLSEDWRRATCVVAHPDDLEYGAASAVARWTDAGKEVAYVMVTSGEAGIEGRDPAIVRPLREDEERASAAQVGVREIEFLGLPDGLLEYGLPLRRAIAGALRKLRPEIVVTMNFALSWGESGSVNHADHRAVGLATLDACRDAANSWVWPELGPRWAGVGAAYVVGDEEPTHFVDVGATIDRGVASLREHRQYLEGLGTDFDPDTFLRQMAQFGGVAAGCEAAVLLRRYGV